MLTLAMGAAVIGPMYSSRENGAQHGGYGFLFHLFFRALAAVSCSIGVRFDSARLECKVKLGQVQLGYFRKYNKLCKNRKRLVTLG